MPELVPLVMKLNHEELKEISFGNTIWQVSLREGVELKTVLDPLYWSRVANRLKAGDCIQVRTVDHAFYAELYVRAASDNEARVQLMASYTLGTAAHIDNGPLDVKWNVGRRGYDVIRVSDKAVIQDGTKFPLKEQALAWIEQHLKTLAA